MKIKTALFYCIVGFPALVLLGIAVHVSRDLYDINMIAEDEIYLSIQDHLDKKTPPSFPLPHEVFNIDRSRQLVFLFGGSSLLLSDGGTFHDYLEQNHPELQVINFGVNGIDSFSVRKRVQEALVFDKPDIIILYYGHNDYNNAYQGHIAPNYFRHFDFYLTPSYFLRDPDKPEGVILLEGYDWFARLRRPLLYELFEKAGLIDLDSRDFERVNRLILEHFIRNNQAIIDIASNMGVPIVLITPVGNLHAKPYGDIETTHSDFVNSKTTTDYHHSLSHLKKARDTEFLTYDLRAKTGLIDYLRDISHPNVYVLDLEKKLEQLRFGFGYGDFLDYFHFTDKSHRLVAEIIYDFLKEKNLVKGRGNKRAAENNTASPGKFQKK